MACHCFGVPPIFDGSLRMVSIYSKYSTVCCHQVAQCLLPVSASGFLTGSHLRQSCCLRVLDKLSASANLPLFYMCKCSVGKHHLPRACTNQPCTCAAIPVWGCWNLLSPHCSCRRAPVASAAVTIYGGSLMPLAVVQHQLPNCGSFFPGSWEAGRDVK